MKEEIFCKASHELATFYGPVNSIRYTDGLYHVEYAQMLCYDKIRRQVFCESLPKTAVVVKIDYEFNSKDWHRLQLVENGIDSKLLDENELDDLVFEE